jgi:RNA polymerase sigma-70 factor (ECF subfamily)
MPPSDTRCHGTARPDKLMAPAPTASSTIAQNGVDQVRRQLAALLPDLRAFARFLARGSSEADDLVQETVVRALSAASQFEPGTNLRAWLFTILRNLFFEQQRRRRREAVALQGGKLPDEASAPSQPGATDLADLHRMLWSLPVLQREALVLVGAQGLSYEEAAAICGVPIGTVKARVSRARRQLALIAGALAPEGFDPAAAGREET